MGFLERVRLIFRTATLGNDKRRLVKFPLIAFQVCSRLARELFNRWRGCDILYTEYPDCAHYPLNGCQFKKNAVNCSIEAGLSRAD